MSDDKKPTSPSARSGGTPAVCVTAPCPLKCNPAVTIDPVRRGNPYAALGVTSGDSISASIPPSNGYKVKVTVNPSMSSCPGEYIELSIVNGSGDNGSATVAPTRITTTTEVVITGGNQTKPGHKEKLKVEARLSDGTIKATSAGFTVCAHPLNYRDPFHSDIDTPRKVGVAVADDWDSDSGTFADLDKTKISELVDYVGANDSPPFTARGAMAFNNSGYLPGNQKTVDSHSMGRAGITVTGPAGISEASQLCIYKCERCGVIDIVLPNSGFLRTHTVFKSGGVWKHKTNKKGAAVTIGVHTTGAGAGNATSSDHNL